MQIPLRFVFFFQAEDGIRDVAVTGVQTCALPILGVLPTKERPLKQYDGRLSPPRSRTLCWLGPSFIQVTCPPTPMVTFAGLKAKSTMWTGGMLVGLPACTVTEPLIIAP